MSIENKEIINGEDRLATDIPNNSMDNGKITENFQNIIRQQQEQIDQLIKQQELSKKINQNLTETLSQKILREEEEKKDKFAWVDEVIAKNFHHNYDLDETNPIATEHTDKLAVWYMNYLKDKKNQTNAQIHSRFDRIFRTLATGKQTEHESKI